MKRLTLVILAACRATSVPSQPQSAAADASADADAGADAGADADADADADAAASTREEIGPFEIPSQPERTVWYARPRSLEEHRLIAHLHGQCAPPVYSCGQWLDAGASRGYLVCPTGNEHCGSPAGPAMWDESFALMDQDLEKGVAAASKREGDGGIARGGAVMTGFSRGGWAAIEIVRNHPGRWPFLILIEADVTIQKWMLDAAKVERVAMIAAEKGTELAGEQKSVDALVAAGYPAKLFVMPGSWHLYSADIDVIMKQALDFVLEGTPPVSAGSAAR